MNKQRLETLDIDRAICIVLVVIGHFNPASAPSWWKSINLCIYSFHMPVFLFISGFVYAYFFKKISYKDFFTKKVKRLLVPYLITSFIVIGIKLLTQGNAYVEHPVTAKTFLEIFYLPAAGYYLWFVWALFIMLAIARIIHNRLVHAILLALSVVIYYLPYEMPATFCLNEFQEKWVFFMCGVVLAECGISGVLHSRWLIGAAIITYPVLYFLFTPIGRSQYLIIAIAGIAMVCAVASVLSKLNWAKKYIFKPLSMASFTIYLYHTTFSGFAKATIAKLALPSDWFVAEALFVTFCGIIFPLAIHHFLTRSPRLKWIIGE